jgi:alpha-glucan,water dikinase
MQDNVELAACARDWDRLMQAPGENRFKGDWALHTKSVVDRIGRALGAWTDGVYRLLQPKAELLGQAFGAEFWTINLFSEEVVRGSSLAFALSMLLRQLGRTLRERAHLGSWEIVSRGRGTGKVEVVERLGEVQARQFDRPTLVIADRVMGDEELPREIIGVIAPDVTDLVSHVAVRARNAQVLFASCADPELFERLKSRRGQVLSLEVTPSGDVTIREAAQVEAKVEAPMTGQTRSIIKPAPFSGFAVTIEQFTEELVGSKSSSQARLKGKLPSWVRQPASVSLPFKSFEKVLSLNQNKQQAQRFEDSLRQLQERAGGEALATVRSRVEELTAPDELKNELRKAFGRSGIEWPQDWEAAWRGIKQVWASKWNERAFLSRKKMGIKDEDLFMAVLVQPVIPADYAFVLHTVNPSTDNAEELYGEVVLGLGETLVGNFPGRALGFVWNKKTEQVRVISYPSKSIGLYGGGLIFRSDSNGEDLSSFAGAGLYDSMLLNSAQETVLDYSKEPLVWDAPLRECTLGAIGRLGLAIEKALGSAQDIEGVVAKGEYFVVQTRPQVGLQNR